MGALSATYRVGQNRVEQPIVSYNVSHLKLWALSLALHLEWDYVPANLPIQARWFRHVAVSGNQMENAQMLLIIQEQKK